MKPPTMAAATTTANSQRGPGSRLMRRRRPTRRGGRVRSARSRQLGAFSRLIAAEPSNLSDAGRRVSNPIAPAGGGSVFSFSLPLADARVA